MSAPVEPTSSPTPSAPSASPSAPPVEPSSSANPSGDVTSNNPPPSTTDLPPSTTSQQPPSSEPPTPPSSANPGSSQPPGQPSTPINPGSSTTGDGGGGSVAPPASSQSGLPANSGVQSGSASKTSDQTAIIVTVTMTDANGHVQTAIETRPISSGSKSNVGAIVGGVVGGVCGAIAIAILVWLLFRRRKRNYREDFDDMMNHAPIDLAETESTPQVDPYKYTPVEGVAATSTGHLNQGQYGNYAAYDNYGNQPQMEQTSYGPTIVSGTSESGYPNAAGVGAGVPQAVSGTTSSSGTSAGYVGMGPSYPAGNPGYGMPVPMVAANTSGPSDMSHMSPKQQEAYQESQRLAVQNQTAPANVTVHQDGGAFTEAQASGSEIPPTYDSIRR